MKSTLSILIAIWMLPSVVHGQAAMEQELMQAFKKIHQWRDYNDEDENVSKYDSLEQANDHFLDLLLHHASKNKSSLSAPFTALQEEGLMIAGAADGSFRIYSWDTWTGGTMHFFRNVYQYTNEGRLFAEIAADTSGDEDPGVWYSEIYSIINKEGSWYLGLHHAIYSNRDAYQGIKVFRIAGNQLDHNAKLIKTTTGIRNRLGFSFDFFSVVDRPERPVRLIRFDPASKTLSIPVVLPDGKVTGRAIEYRFTGRYFERKK